MTDSIEPPADKQDASSPPERPRKRRPPLLRALGCLLQVLGVAFLALALVALGGAAAFRWWARRDSRTPGPSRTVLVEVRKGDSLRTVARRIEEAGVAGPEPLLVALALLEKADRRLLPGRYALERGMPPRDVLRRLTHGPDIPTAQVTIPEGWTCARIAQRLAEARVAADTERFLALCADPPTLEALEIPAQHAQGYLFPDTYRFEIPTDPPEALARLARRFRQVLDELGLQPGINSPHAYGLTLHQSVTLASIVEREARHADEMPAIAAVFHNRLRRGMRLDSCATVRYALGKWNAPLTRSDLDTDSPYNTYKIKGLPPGPICNPGRAAIESAFRPADSKYLYYVYKGNGRHAFSTSLRQHEALRRKYRDAWAFSAEEGKED